MTLSAMALAIVIVAAIPSPARADNPIVQTFYTADPAPMVHEGRLYLYTSHDEDVTVNDFYTMNDWRLYSTTDMVNWTDHGSPAGLKTFSWSTDSAWAPQGIFRNNKWYLYVPLNNNTGARIGVGVSNTPAGPFMDPLGRQLAASGSGNIDPTVFVDDDGQAYMYWGNGTLRYVRLNSDMTSTSGSITNVSLSGFTEGPWFYKRGSLYYMVYAATSGSEKISYATSNSPTGPWTVRGDIMPPGSTFTNHAGIVDYKGHSYFFYHNSALPGGNNYKRSVCVEEFTYGADGSIPRHHDEHERTGRRRHAESVHASRGRDHRLLVRAQDRGVHRHRRRHERHVHQQWRLHQGEERRFPGRRDLLRGAGIVRSQQREDRAPPRQSDRHAARDV